MTLFAELKRRNVFRVAVAYLVFAWLVLQVADVVFPALKLPDWSIALVIVLLAIGFVAALIVSWVYELTPEGIKRESEVDRSQSITPETGRRLNLITIAMVGAAVLLLVADRVLFERAPAPTETSPGIIDTTPIIAVLPFKATGSDDGGFLATGLHDDLLTRLAKLDAYKVISRTSMMEYADTTKNIRQIGEELGAGYILEGGVQSLGQRVRINAQLIDADADEHIWADTYDRQLTAEDLFDVQAELARAIAEQLHLALSDSDQAVVAAVPTRNTEAYQAYLRGLELLEKGSFTSSNLTRIAEAFEEAVELDPEFTLAWARLSIARSALSQVDDDEAIRAAALSALAEARTLDPDLPEVEIAWVQHLYRSLSEYEQALEALESLEARAGLNSDATQLKAFLLRRVGRFEEAYATMLEADRLEPRSTRIKGDLVSLAIANNQCEAAGRHVHAAFELAGDNADILTSIAEYEMECHADGQRASEIMKNAELEAAWHLITAWYAAIMAGDEARISELADIPAPVRPPGDTVIPRLHRAAFLRVQGRDQEAEAILDDVAATVPELERLAPTTRMSALTLYTYYGLRGDQAETRRWIDEFRERLAVETKGDRYAITFQRFDFADILAHAGLDDDAIAELRVMLEQPGGRSFRMVDAWPVFERLKGQPGYEALRAEFGDAR